MNKHLAIVVVAVLIVGLIAAGAGLPFRGRVNYGPAGVEIQIGPDGKEPPPPVRGPLRRR